MKQKVVLNPCPPPGSGIHVWLFYAANRLHDAGLSPSEATPCLIKIVRARHPDRINLRNEVLSTIRKVWNVSCLAYWNIPGGTEANPRPAKVTVMWPNISEIVRHGARVADIAKASPVCMDNAAEVEAEALIDRLFPGNPLLCVAREGPADAITAPRESFRGKLAQSALIVPSPMTALTGFTQEGRTSVRSLNNTGPRFYLVVEFDFKQTKLEELAKLKGHKLEGAKTVNALMSSGLSSQEMCAALGWHLTKFHKGKLAAVVSSGGKSLHFWLNVKGMDEMRIAAWFAVARRLGADPATWPRCQLVRLPGGLRDDGKRQTVIYFNPANVVTDERKEIER